MGSLFYNSKERQNPLMDFAEILFGETPQTITQAGIDDDAERFRLKFDGSKLRLMKGEKEAGNWNGVSGIPGYQSPEFQHLKDKGPLPEGRYSANQGQYQKMDMIDAIAGLIGKGRFPGSHYSWGSERVWLTPDKDTNTYGRKNFSIHGGWVPGSKGCIDLTSDNRDFMNVFLTIGRDLPLDVKYSNQPKPKELNKIL